MYFTLIRHGDNGMVADPGASDQFVRAALDLVTRPGALKRIAAAAPVSVAELNWERIHEHLLGALRAAIAGRAAGVSPESMIRFLPD